MIVSKATEKCNIYSCECEDTPCYEVYIVALQYRWDDLVSYQLVAIDTPVKKTSNLYWDHLYLHCLWWWYQAVTVLNLQSLPFTLLLSCSIPPEKNEVNIFLRLLFDQHGLFSQNSKPLNILPRYYWQQAKCAWWNWLQWFSVKCLHTLNTVYTAVWFRSKLLFNLNWVYFDWIHS